VSCSKYEFFLVRRSDILVDVLKKCSKECFDETAEISVSMHSLHVHVVTRSIYIQISLPFCWILCSIHYAKQMLDSVF